MAFGRRYAIELIAAAFFAAQFSSHASFLRFRRLPYGHSPARLKAAACFHYFSFRCYAPAAMLLPPDWPLMISPLLSYAFIILAFSISRLSPSP